MTKNPIVAAITEVLAQMTDLMGEDAARQAIRSVVAASLARVLGTEAPKAKAPKKQGGTSGRGPKPGGRQLKAHIGAKAFANMPADLKDKARQAISKVAAQWKTMSDADKNALLAKVGVTPQKV